MNTRLPSRWGGHGTNRHSQWVNVDKSKSDGVFWLVDETGQCLIDPQGANVITAPEQTDRWLGHTARPTSGPQKRGSRFGLFPGQSYSSFHFGNGLWFSTRRNYRYMERRIPEGASLYVIGQFKKMNNGAGNNNASVSELLRSWKSNQKEMLDRFDSDRDGRIDVDEWEAARKAAESEVTQHDPQPAGKEVSVLGATGDRSKPFLISAIPQSELLGRYRLLCRLGIATAVTGTLMVGLLIVGR
jgi:hypothetical protein